MAAAIPEIAFAVPSALERTASSTPTYSDKGYNEKHGDYSAQVVPAADDNVGGVSGPPEDKGGLKRGLKGRHVVFISLGSIIGPGTFYGLGYGMVLSGPVGCIIGFAVTGALLWILMNGLGEVTTLFPIRGGWVEHTARFVDPAICFATTWLYYLMWAFSLETLSLVQDLTSPSTVLGSEFNAATLVMQYWVPTSSVPSWGWTIIFWAIFNCLTLFPVQYYGEIEFFLSFFKFAAAIVIFILCIVCNAHGFGGGYPYLGFKYFDPPFKNGINGFGQVFVLAATYCVGTEILSLNAGETKSPRKSVPQGVISIVYRIFIVYVGLCFFQAIVCSADAPDLLGASSTSGSSPFTIGFSERGWKHAGDFINAIIIITFFSAGNGCVYVMSRSLHSMACTGRAPSFFSYTNRFGVPVYSVVFSNLWCFTQLMNLSLGAGTVFTYFTSVCGTACFISWVTMVFTHLRVRHAARVQGISHERFPFKAIGGLWLYYFNLGAFVFLLFIQGFSCFVDGFHYKTFIVDYITIPAWIVLWAGFKWWHKTHFVRLDEIDFSDADLLDDDEVEEYRRKSKTTWKKKVMDALRGY